MGASSQRLQVWRRVSGTDYLTLVGRSAFESFPPGVVGTHPTRIGVDAGDLLGLRWGAACIHFGAPGDVAAFDEDGATDPVPGDTKTFIYNEGILVNVAAVLEPDADGDGFGDETQDGCPTDASRQGPCAPSPPDTSIALSLDAKRKQKVKKVEVEVGCGDEACEAKLRGAAVARKKRGRRSDAAAAKRKRKRFKVKRRTFPVAAGQTETRRVRFKKHKKSVRKMRRLLRREAFRKQTKAKIKVQVTDAAGNAAADRVKVRLRR